MTNVTAFNNEDDLFGDHAKNISEQVIFVVEGRDIRHNKEAIK